MLSEEDHRYEGKKGNKEKRPHVLGKWPLVAKGLVFWRLKVGESYYDQNDIIQLKVLGQIIKDLEMGKRSLNVLSMECWMLSSKSLVGI